LGYLLLGFFVLPLGALYLVDRLDLGRFGDKTVWRARVLWICGIVVIVQLPWYLPPRQSEIKHVADRLAARAACPRPIPAIVSDSTAGLSALQRCGVIWTALKAMPPGGVAYLEAHDANLEHVMVLSLSDVMGLHGLRLLQQPRLLWFERQRMSSAWVVVVAISAAEYESVCQVWVDKRTGVARRIIMACSH
jgi:hypothetical protein